MNVGLADAWQSELFLHKRDNVAHGFKTLSIPIRNLNVELILQRHYGFDHIEAGGP